MRDGGSECRLAGASAAENDMVAAFGGCDAVPVREGVRLQRAELFREFQLEELRAEDVDLRWWSGEQESQQG